MHALKSTCDLTITLVHVPRPIFMARENFTQYVVYHLYMHVCNQHRWLLPCVCMHSRVMCSVASVCVCTCIINEYNYQCRAVVNLQGILILSGSIGTSAGEHSCWIIWLITHRDDDKKIYKIIRLMIPWCMDRQVMLSGFTSQLIRTVWVLGTTQKIMSNELLA